MTNAAIATIASTHVCDPTPVSPEGPCSQCALGRLCFPHALPDLYRVLLPMAREKRTRLNRGEYLFHAHTQQTGIYAIKAGFLKTCMNVEDGQSKIVGFHATGDALGLGGLGNGTHTTDAVALNDCEVCVISLEKFGTLLEHPTESIHVRQLLAREITRSEAHAAAVSTLSSKQLVARFLLDISVRWEERGYSKNEFVLFMSRKEIGSFLGLTFETVSRTLSYFQSKKWITVQDKNLLIRDMPALQSQLSCAKFGRIPAH